jgi:SAM-dependent methyltransferase
MTNSAVPEKKPSAVWHPEYRPCPICGSASHRVLGRRGGAAHRIGLGVETAVVRCVGCHGVYPRPFMIPEGNPYESHDASEYFEAHDSLAKAAAGRTIARRAAQVLGGVGRVLEIGCGRGELLLGARDEGWEVEGVDLTEWGSHGIPIERASAETCRSLDRERHYDFIILAAVIEHLYSPTVVLRRCVGALRPRGIVYIDAPNECSLWTRVGNASFRMRGRDWAINLSPTFPPYHVVGFCPKSLRLALVQSGLEVLQLDTIAYRNVLPRRPGLYGTIEHVAANTTIRLGTTVGMGAGLSCWARKSL